MQRLSRRQRNRVPEGNQRSGTTSDLPQYSRKSDADQSFATLLAQGKTTEDVADAISAAYGEESVPEEEISYIAGQPVPNDPGDPAAGEKREYPPPPSPVDGGTSPT